MRKLAFVNLSRAARAAIIAGLVICLFMAGVVADYLVAGWRAHQAVQQSVQQSVGKSEQALCGIINLVTAVPQQPPAHPAANPSRVTSYRWYVAFVAVGRQYHC